MSSRDSQGTPSPFEALRTVTMTTPAREPQDWTADMAAVSGQRSRESFLRIYDHFMPRVCLYLRGLGVVDSVAEELAQEALLRLWQRAGQYDPARSGLCTWLFRIARNLHIDRVRQEPGWIRIQEAIESLPDDLAPQTSSTEDYTEQVQLHRRVDALSAVQARLIRMSYFEAKSHQEIAEELGMPLGTVKSHLRRAFQRLQHAVGDTP